MGDGGNCKPFCDIFTSFSLCGVAVGNHLSTCFRLDRSFRKLEKNTGSSSTRVCLAIRSVCGLSDFENLWAAPLHYDSAGF